MSAYLIELDYTVQDDVRTTTVGPFADGGAAADFAAEMSMGERACGYEVHVISDDECGFTPESYREWYIETYGEGE